MSTAGICDDSLAVFRTNQGVEVRATLLRLSRYAASCEVYNPDIVIRASEALEDFKIFVKDKPVYAGRAIVRDCVNAGTFLVCSVDLDDLCFDFEFFGSLSKEGRLRTQFEDFVKQWQGVCKVLPEFKVAVADIQTFLIDLRHWMEQVELGVRSSPNPDRVQQERRIIGELSPQVNLAIDTLFEKFEQIAGGLNEEARPVHRSYVQRLLHPIVLCAPFAWRSYQKPLGYAGDYEMVNMMLRDPQEGSTLFAKIFNVWLLQQESATAHRNRVNFLKRQLLEAAAAAERAGRQCRILNLGCGPAFEIQEFLTESALSNSVNFSLFDFNDETLRHTSEVLRQKKQQYRRATSIALTKKSVQQLLKDMSKAESVPMSDRYDFIYSAGLFDYLSDRICKRLTTLFHQSLSPGGILLTTNVAPTSPNRGSLGLILDWHLIYRNVAELAALKPEGASEEEVRVLSDDTGINLFLEVRKSNAL